MRHTKRHADILRIVREEGTVSIAALAERLSVSQETIRRDVQPLAVHGELVKVHGAITLPHRIGEAPYEKRMREFADEKRALSRRVAGLIADGDTLMLDTGTTMSFVARALLDKRDLTIVTNSADIARTLATVNGNRVFMAGGQLRGDIGASYGTAAVEFIRRFKVRHAIITIGAIDAVHGPMDYHLEEAEFAREVLARGDNRMIVTDHSKFDRTALVEVCGFDGFDALVTDRAPPPALAEVLDAHGVEVLLPEEGSVRTADVA